MIAPDKIQQNQHLQAHAGNYFAGFISSKAGSSVFLSLAFCIGMAQPFAPQQPVLVIAWNKTKPPNTPGKRS
jgi:hypothetical protein